VSRGGRSDLVVARERRVDVPGEMGHYVLTERWR
jgi:hypothetical protein